MIHLNVFPDSPLSQSSAKKHLRGLDAAKAWVQITSQLHFCSPGQVACLKWTNPSWQIISQSVHTSLAMLLSRCYQQEEHSVFRSSFFPSTMMLLNHPAYLSPQHYLSVEQLSTLQFQGCTAYLVFMGLPKITDHLLYIYLSYCV